jgi:hypothetical protein
MMIITSFLPATYFARDRLYGRCSHCPYPWPTPTAKRRTDDATARGGVGVAVGAMTATGCTTFVAGWAAHGFVRPPPRLAAKTASASPQWASPLTTAAAGIGKADRSGRREEERRMWRQWAIRRAVGCCPCGNCGRLCRTSTTRTIVPPARRPEQGGERRRGWALTSKVAKTYLLPIYSCCRYNLFD